MTTPLEHLRAMKVRAARATRDAEDLRILLAALQLESVSEVLEIVARFFPDEPLTERSRQLVEDLLEGPSPEAL